MRWRAITTWFFSSSLQHFLPKNLLFRCHRHHRIKVSFHLHMALDRKPWNRLTPHAISLQHSDGFPFLSFPPPHSLISLSLFTQYSSSEQQLRLNPTISTQTKLAKSMAFPCQPASACSHVCKPLTKAKLLMEFIITSLRSLQRLQ